MIRIRSVLKYQLPPSSPLLQSPCNSYNNVCKLLSSVPKPTFWQSTPFTSLMSLNLCGSTSFNDFVYKPTLPAKRFKFLLSNENFNSSNKLSFCTHCDQNEFDEYAAEFEEKNLIGKRPDGPAYSRFADQYRFKAEELKKNLSKTSRLDKLFELIHDNIDYVGRINSGVFISRLSHLTDPREKTHKKLTLKQIDFLTKLVLVNVNVLADANLLSLVAIILSQKLSDDHKLTITTLHEIRRRLKDFEINNLIWLWKQSGFRMKSSEKSKEWRKLREEIINVVEKKVENFQYDFQNVTEISQLSRVLLTKSSSMPYLNGLIKNITVFTESIDYGLAWALLVQLSTPYRRFGRIESKDLETIQNKCFKVIQDQFYENNFRVDTYVKEFFLDRMVESPEYMKLPYNQSFFQTLKKLVKKNQKYMEPKKISKCLDFFGFNRYYPADLIQSYCTWITDHPDDYLSDPDHNPTNLVKLFSESRFFETKKDQWNNFSKLLLDPVKLTCLSQIDRFHLLSYLMIMNDYSHLQSFCPEFDGLLEKMNLQKNLWRSYLHIYAGLSREESKLNIEGQLIKKSLDKLAKRARKSSIFIDRPDNSDDYLDILLANVFGDRSLYSRRVWTSTCILLNYVFLMDKNGNLHKFQSRGRNNVAVLDDIVQGLNNFHVFVLFPIDESHFCHEPLIMRGKYDFKLSLIRHHGFIPIIIDKRNWKDLNEKQKISILNREIEKAKSKCVEVPK